VLAEDTAVQDGVFVVSGPTRTRQREVNSAPRSCAPEGSGLGLLRESPEAASLQELAWLVGSWVYSSDGNKVMATTMTGSASGADSETVKSASFSVPNSRS
jgi:hypothetical protein